MIQHAGRKRGGEGFVRVTVVAAGGGGGEKPMDGCRGLGRPSCLFHDCSPQGESTNEAVQNRHRSHFSNNTNYGKAPHNNACLSICFLYSLSHTHTHTSTRSVVIVGEQHNRGMLFPSSSVIHCERRIVCHWSRENQQWFHTHTHTHTLTQLSQVSSVL